ncbi:hypothetical protein J2Y38_003055 [Flavobacterium sp. 2755]|uniref:hypothetical protein n=1 Tax=Flavobacterium sp. 2755 TaxID=2817765 RepID=UPI002864552B|nr:hypothetical protein [Flavobacterium sp. 2755]MDR6762837.1 hypothetical protein [Flavobacterium sp. 2755]
MLKKHPRLLIGLLIVILSTFFFFCIMMIPLLISEPYESNKYNEIEVKGVNIIGTVINIKQNLNITINNDHPTVISYKFKWKGNELNSKFRTLDNDKIVNLKINDTLQIKYLNGESKVAGLDPFAFSITPFLMIPLPFFIIGLSLIFFSLKPYLTERRANKKI